VRGDDLGGRYAITGSTGLVGSRLAGYLEGKGARVTRIVRSRPTTEDHIGWDPLRGEIDAGGLEGHDVVVHLAGEPIAGLWTGRKKVAIVRSRVEGTRLLSEALAGLDAPPRLLLSASAVGYYGDREPDEVVVEGDEPGIGFLANTVVAWEGATAPAIAAGIRVVHLRFGVVIAETGGMVGALRPLFRLGLGAVMGGGDQVMSWVALAEIPRVVEYLVGDDSITGPVNVVSPNPVSNAEFTRALGRMVGRPTPFRIPAWLLRGLGGEMAEEMILSGARVEPARLLDSGYDFRYRDLDLALSGS